MNIAALILAAGQSSRMGAFKPLLPWGKRTVIESCINYFREGGIDSIVVVVGHRADEIRSHLASASVTFAVNPDLTSAMSDSIRIGAGKLPLKAHATFITPVDCPAIPAKMVSAIAAEWAKGCRLIQPTHQGRGGHPVLIDLSLRDELLNLDSKLGLKGLFEAHRGDVKRFEVESPYIARDIDTWDDYRALYAEVLGEDPPQATGNHSNENPAGLI